MPSLLPSPSKSSPGIKIQVESHPPMKTSHLTPLPDVCQFWILILLHICDTYSTLWFDNLCYCLCFILLIIMRSDVSKLFKGGKYMSYPLSSFLSFSPHFNNSAIGMHFTINGESNHFRIEWQCVLVESIWVCFCQILPIWNYFVCVCVLLMSDSLPPHGLLPTRLLCPWDFPGKNAGVGSNFLLQGNFLTQGLNPGLLHCRQILYNLSHQGSPKIL